VALVQSLNDSRRAWRNFFDSRRAANRPRSTTEEKSIMRKHVVTGLTVGAMAIAALVDAQSATAAPSGPVSAQDTVNQLRSEGYRIILNKVGCGSLDQCTVSAVRSGQPVTQLDATGDDTTLHELYTPLYVTTNC
jgi:hypothetical protein